MPPTLRPRCGHRAEHLPVRCLSSQHAAQTNCRHAQAAAVGLQSPPLKFAVVIAGFSPRDPGLAQLFSRPLSLPSLHIIGERDALKRASAQLMAAFHVHTAIWHKQGAGPHAQAGMLFHHLCALAGHAQDISAQ